MTKSILFKKLGQPRASGRTSPAPKANKKQFLGKTVLSIDIGQNTTKLVLGRVVSPTSIEIKRAVAFPTPHGSMEKGRILNSSALSAEIEQVIKHQKLAASHVFCSIENAEIITREITLPTADATEMAHMLEYEVQQYMPIDLGNYIIQSKLLDSFEDEGAKKTRFLSTAVPKDLAQSYFELMQKINLKASVLDIQSNAIDKLVMSERAAAAQDSVFPSTGAVAIVDLGCTHINVILMKDGKFLFNRYIDRGSAEIDRSLKSVFDYSAEEIEHRKQTVIDLSTSGSLLLDSRNDADQIALRELNVVKNVIDTWAEELDRVLKYFSSRSAGEPVQKVLIHGGNAQIKGIDDYLAKVLGISVDRIETLNCVSMQDSAAFSMTPFFSAIGALIRR